MVSNLDNENIIAFISYSAYFIWYSVPANRQFLIRNIKVKDTLKFLIYYYISQSGTLRIKIF